MISAGDDDDSASSISEATQWLAREAWVYLDQNGDAQGPFDTATMQGWVQAGYFGVDTEVMCVERSGNGSPSRDYAPLFTFEAIVGTGYADPRRYFYCAAS